MSTLLETKLDNHPTPYFMDWELELLLDNSEHSRYGMLKRAT